MITPLLSVLCAAVLAAPAESLYKPDANAPRAAVPEPYRWDLSPFFSDDAAWEAGFADAGRRISALAVPSPRQARATSKQSRTIPGSCGVLARNTSRLTPSSLLDKAYVNVE